MDNWYDNGEGSENMKRSIAKQAKENPVPNLQYKYERELEKCVILLGKNYIPAMGCNGLMQVSGHLKNILAELAKLKGWPMTPLCQQDRHKHGTWPCGEICGEMCLLWNTDKCERDEPMKTSKCPECGNFNDHHLATCKKELRDTILQLQTDNESYQKQIADLCLEMVDLQTENKALREALENGGIIYGPAKTGKGTNQ